MGTLAGWFKTKWLVSELITTLMMNYIAILWVNYLVYGAWRDPKGLNFPLTAAFSESALLPSFGDLRVHAGIIIVFVLAAVLTVVFEIPAGATRHLLLVPILRLPVMPGSIFPEMFCW